MYKMDPTAPTALQFGWLWLIFIEGVTSRRALCLPTISKKSIVPSVVKSWKRSLLRGEKPRKEKWRIERLAAVLSLRRVGYKSVNTVHTTWGLFRTSHAPINYLIRRVWCGVNGYAPSVEVRSI